VHAAVHEGGDVGLGGECALHAVEVFRSGRGAVAGEVQSGTEAPAGTGEDDDTARTVPGDARQRLVAAR